MCVWREARGGCHFLTYEFLDEVCNKHEKNLKHHIAEKKINYIDETGMFTKPTTKNGIKLEKFIFDIFPFASKFAVWEVVRRDEFSPLKNGANELNDNEVTCRKHILEQHARWIEDAGFDLEQKDGSMSDFEISPLVSYSGEGLKFPIDITSLELSEFMALEKRSEFSDAKKAPLSDQFVLLSGIDEIKSFYKEAKLQL